MSYKETIDEPIERLGKFIVNNFAINYEREVLLNRQSFLLFLDGLKEEESFSFVKLKNSNSCNISDLQSNNILHSVNPDMNKYFFIFK